jgi:hypothetical protein
MKKIKRQIFIDIVGSITLTSRPKFCKMSNETFKSYLAMFCTRRSVACVCDLVAVCSTLSFQYSAYKYGGTN